MRGRRALLVLNTAEHFGCGLRASLQLTARHWRGDRDGVRGARDDLDGCRLGDRRRGEADRARRQGGRVRDLVRGGLDS